MSPTKLVNAKASRLPPMASKLEVARQAALRLFEDVVDLKFVETLKTDEDVFLAGRQGQKGSLTVTLNPNGTKAAVEWKGSRSKQSTDYRVFKVEGVPTTDDNLSDTDENLPVAG